MFLFAFYFLGPHISDSHFPRGFCSSGLFCVCFSGAFFIVVVICLFPLLNAVFLPVSSPYLVWAVIWWCASSFSIFRRKGREAVCWDRVNRDVFFPSSCLTGGCLGIESSCFSLSWSRGSWPVLWFLEKEVLQLTGTALIFSLNFALTLCPLKVWGSSHFPRVLKSQTIGLCWPFHVLGGCCEILPSVIHSYSIGKIVRCYFLDNFLFSLLSPFAGILIN